jgi:hypothetical protein
MKSLRQNNPRSLFILSRTTQHPNEGVQEAHGVLSGDIILQPFGEEQRLGAVQSGAMIHACIRPSSGVKVSKNMTDFSHSLSLQATRDGAFSLSRSRWFTDVTGPAYLSSGR